MSYRLGVDVGGTFTDLIPEQKQYFEDYLCDDGRGMGPYKAACHLWRDGE